MSAETWEYTQITVGPRATNDKSLNQLGAEGWEAYAVNVALGHVTFYLRRKSSIGDPLE